MPDSSASFGAGRAGEGRDRKTVPPFPPHSSVRRCTVAGNVRWTRSLAWRGASVQALAIESSSGEIELKTSMAELCFLLRCRHHDLDIKLANTCWKAPHEPRWAYVIPEGREITQRVNLLEDAQILKVGFEHEFLLRAAGLSHARNFELAPKLGYDDPLSWQLASSIYEECKNNAPGGRQFIETGATLLAMQLVRRCIAYSGEINLCWRGGLAPSALRRACDFMMSNLSREVSVVDVASLVGLSAGHFTTVFKQSVGCSPHAWLRRERIMSAQTLLHDASLSLRAVALQVGYANQSAFGVCFKRQTGLTPAAWRRRQIFGSAAVDVDSYEPRGEWRLPTRRPSDAPIRAA
jgi:AraC family transcriptional regulator